MMTATGLAARDPQMSHKLMFRGLMSPAAASKSVTSANEDFEPRNLMIFHEILFFYDILRCLVVYTYANNKSDAFEHDS